MATDAQEAQAAPDSPFARPPTSYVRLPVPEELVREVQLLMFFLGLRIPTSGWFPETLVEHLADVDEEHHGFLVRIARRSLEGPPITIAEMAANLGVPEAEVFAVVGEINAAVVLGDIVFLRSVDDPESGGRRHQVVLRDDVARTVLEQLAPELLPREAR